MWIESFLVNNQNDINKVYDDPESVFAYISQLPVETLTDLETISKIIHKLLVQLFEENFNKNLLNIFRDLKCNNFIYLFSKDTNSTHRINVRDPFILKILLFLSLKYSKSLRQETYDSKYFIQSLLREIIETISVSHHFSLHLLKLVEMILKKRGDVLLPDLSLFILKSMTKAAYSPITGFKHCAQNINRIVLSSLSQDTKKYLCSFNNFLIKGIDLKDTLKLCTEKQLQDSLNFVNNLILKLFCNNTDSRDASFYYEAVTYMYGFQDFTEKIWPFYGRYFEEFDEGEFYQSFLKYWIPITVKQYKDEFYLFLLDKNVDFYLKAHTLLETKMKGFYDKQKFDGETYKFIQYSKTSQVGLRIVSIYTKKAIFPDQFEAEMVRFFLSNFSQCEIDDYDAKSLKQFISQVFLVCHLSVDKAANTDLNLFSNFLDFVFKFCSTRLTIPESCKTSAQLLKIVWDVATGSSSDLLTCCKIDRENAYEIGENLYFQQLRNTGFWHQTFLSRPLIIQIECFFQQKPSCCSNLIDVIRERYLEYLNLNNLPNLEQLVDDASQSVCLQSSGKSRSYADLILSFRKMKNKSYTHEVSNLSDIFLRKIHRCDLQELFTCVLILDVFINISKNDDLDISPLIYKSFSFFRNIFNENLNYDLNPKKTKVLEALINNVIEYLTISTRQWPKFDSETLLHQLCFIVEKSNMKRPVSLASKFIYHFGSFMENSEKGREAKIKLLDRTLNSLYRDKQCGKIRRNPETRLVIHALCLADRNLNKPFLASSLNFMLEVLRNPLVSDSSLSSTLHSLEVLVADNSVHNFTLPFVVEIIEHCVALFDKTSWIVRNADLQLLKSLTERFLGVSLAENVRSKTVEDLFTLFPSLIPYFYEILSKPKLDDGAMIVLLFFSESQIKSNSFIGESLQDVFNQFKCLFVHLMKNYSNFPGFLTVKAFAALCPGEQIPDIISEIVDYIQRRFGTMKKNVFADLIKLLQELFFKFKKLPNYLRRNLIVRVVGDLAKFLRQHDCFYMNLLFLKLYTVEEITPKILSCLETGIDYQRRIWLNNYLPFIIIHTHVTRLQFTLHSILKCQIPEFLQIKILSILVDRSNNKGFPMSEIINILILKLTTLPDNAKFLVAAYSKTIIFFYETTHDFNSSDILIAKVRQNFETNCLYKIFIYILVLANCNCDLDSSFVHSSVQKFIAALGCDEEILVDMSVTLKHLYRCSSPNDRYNVLKLAFHLLLNECASFEVYKFVSWLTKTHCSSALVGVINLVKISNLTSCLGEKRLAIKLLCEFYQYVDHFPDDLQESNTYYLIESVCALPKQYLKVIILKTLSDYSKTLPDR